MNGAPARHGARCRPHGPPRARRVAEPDALLARLGRRADEARQRLAVLRRTETSILAGRDEQEFVRTTGRLGPYLTCRRGIRYEAGAAEWCEWAAGLIRAERRAPHTA